MRIEKKEMKEEKQKMESEIADLKQKALALIEKKEELEEMKTQNESFKNQNDSLNQKIANLQNQLEDKETRLNSVYYFVGAKDRLKDQGKIKGSFLGLCGDRIGDVTAEDFQKRISLQESDVIEINADESNVSSIDNIKLFPKHMEENQDYRVDISGDRKTAQVHLLSKKTFRLARILIVLN